MASSRRQRPRGERVVGGQRGAEHAQVIVERWRRQYNEERPHSALGYRTPAEAAGLAEAPSPPANGRAACGTTEGRPRRTS